MLTAKNMLPDTVNVMTIAVYAGESRVIVKIVVQNETKCLFEAKCAIFCMLLKRNYARVGNRLHFCFVQELKPCERKSTMVN